MSDEVEREMIAQLAELRGASRAQHDEQMRLNRVTQQQLDRIITLGDERERQASQRDAAIHQHISSIMNWQTTHSSDLNAHAPLREELSSVVTTVALLQETATRNKQRLDDLETTAKTRSEVFGFQYRSLLFGLTAAGTIAGILVAIGAI